MNRTNTSNRTVKHTCKTLPAHGMECRHYCVQLRQQSKACEAGLHEGDILLGINGFECQTMSHSNAMALLENAADSISLSVFRSVHLQLAPQ